jgi:hypothetical protein
MLRKLGLGISYFIAIVYILLIVLPCVFTVTSMGGARDRVRGMLLCRPSLLLRWAQSERLSRCATPYNKSEKNNRGPGFFGLLRLFSRLFSSV